MTAPHHLMDRAAELRRAFDDAFAEAPHAQSADRYDEFLAIRLHRDLHAIALAEVARVLPLKAVTRLPGAPAGMLGVAGIAGVVVPVHDLRVLLGYPGDEAPRWIVLAAAAPLALAFDAFDGQFRQRRHETAAGTEPARSVLDGERMVRPLISVASVLASLRSRTPDGVVPREDRHVDVR